MAQALHLSQCGEAGSKDALLPKIISGIEFWKKYNPLCPNWWFNDFGVPMAVDRFLVIMANVTSASGNAMLPQPLFAYGLELLSRGSDPMWRPPPAARGQPYTGENLVWSLQIDIQRGALSGNVSLVAQAFSRMWASLVISPQPGDGIMADGTFHQHGPLLQSGSYGGDLMSDILNFVELSAGTAFSMPPASLAVFVHYLTAGQQYMLRAGQGVPYPSWLIPPRGRSISRPAKSGTPTFPTTTVAAGISALLGLLPPASDSANQLRAFQKVLLGQAPPVNATVIFPDSDYTVHHRPGFSQDVRTWSSRTENAECVNKENLLGEYLADGAAFTYIDGDEYESIFAVWDWRKVPGVLARQEHTTSPACHFESKGITDFVGGVQASSAGVGGVVGMDFAHGPRAAMTSSIDKPDPTCALGISAGTSVCCLRSCGTCGGVGCDHRLGGAAGCCTSVIERGQRSCSAVGAPCKMRPPDPGPETLTAKRAWFLVGSCSTKQPH